MAVGDIVSGLSAATTLLDFQPASGVYVLITSIGNNSENIAHLLYNGTTDSDQRPPGSLGWSSSLNTGKLFINNTRYLRIGATAAASSSYTGITIAEITVNGISADNTLMDFQPASGVTIMITSIGTDATNTAWSLYDGTLISDQRVAASLGINGSANSGKLFINNTRYIRISAAGAGNLTSYSGVTV